MADGLTLTIEALFGVLLAGSLIVWLQRRDRLSRDVVLLLAATGGLLLVEIGRRVVGEVPAWMTISVLGVLLAQPALAVNLAADAGLVRRGWVLAAVVAWAATAVPVMVLSREAPPTLVALAVGAFALTGASAGSVFGVEAARRRGAARMRLAMASAATLLLAAALLVLGLAPAMGDFRALAGILARVAALLSALGYLLAFLPPSGLRRVWRATTGFDYTRRLLDDAAGGATAVHLWQRLAEMARTVTGARLALVALKPETDRDGEAPIGTGVVLVVAAAGDATAPAALVGQSLAGLDLPQRIDNARLEVLGPAASVLASATGGRIVGQLPISGGSASSDADGASGAAGVLLTVTRHPNLFHDDDQELLAHLVQRTAVLVERATVLGEQAALNERLAATVEALQSASQAKSDFLASMSHELRTPLSAVIGFSELMRTEPAAGEGRVGVPVEWVEHVNRSGEHLLSLINDVLDLTKVEAGRLDLQREPVELRHAVSEAIEGVRPLADRKGQRLTATSVPPVWVDVDRGRLRQILYNLLSNGIKFTPDGGAISVSAEADGAQVGVSVADTGIGIAAEDRQRVFEEFSQVGDAATRQAGTGLGLALTRRLVEAHGGRIDLASAPGEGSRFTFSLDLAQPSAPVEAVTAGIETDGRQPGTAPADVLVIEDDAGAIRLLRAYLEGGGYRVQVAGDGERGVEAARSRPPGAIVLDILLPGIDGWEVLRRLKADPALRDIPVIVVTVVDERELGLALGAVDYYLKPVDRSALLARLARYTFTTKVRQRSVRVLAIDDDPAALALVDAALRPEGFKVTGMTDAAAAVEAAVAADPGFDLVICDLVMPGLDGFEVISRLQRNERTRDIPILVLTGRALSAEDKAWLNGHMIGIVEKGGDARGRLLEWLRRAMPVPAAS